jgi:hypothetical protein
LHAGQFRFLVQFEENNLLGFGAETSLKQEIKNVTLQADITVFLGCRRGDE